jgi:hypothetical protein
VLGRLLLLWLLLLWLLLWLPIPSFLGVSVLISEVTLFGGKERPNECFFPGGGGDGGPKGFHHFSARSEEI